MLVSDSSCQIAHDKMSVRTQEGVAVSRGKVSAGGAFGTWLGGKARACASIINVVDGAIPRRRGP